VNFDLSEDETMLKAVAERYVADRYDHDRRSRYLAETNGFCADNWRLLGELGLIATAFSLEAGGLGASPTDIAIIFEALGRGLVVEPLLDSAILAGGLFERIAPDAVKAEWLGDLVTGARRIAVAHAEIAARHNPLRVETTATRDGNDWVLDGAKSIVPGGAGVDAYIVSARISGTPDSPQGVAFFMVAADADGLDVDAYRVIDGSLATALTLRNVRVTAANALGGTLDDLTIAQARASLARCAEALGIMETLFAATLDYLRTRRQFGVAIGSFQALQHRMVAQYTALEQARSLLYVAVIAAPADSDSWLRTIAGARAFISEASVTLGHEMIQLHGGMGVTDELVIGHGHKRLIMLSRHPDTAEDALDRFAGIAA
jgi:alkylation response protein AidB-like acyl-CoA dehydrogenase